MFGWFSFGGGGMRRGGGGCIFLPFLFLCGSFYLFDHLNSGWLLILIAIVVLWVVMSGALRPRGIAEGDPLYDEKPKRDFDDFAEEKPKRTGSYLTRDNGERLEVVEPDEDERPVL